MSSDIDGIYTAYLTGESGQGFGVFVLTRGVLSGADLTGVVFNGSYSVEEDSVVARYKARVPPNVVTVQGDVSGPTGMEYESDIKIPLDFASRPYVRLDTSAGVVNARFNKLRSLD